MLHMIGHAIFGLIIGLVARAVMPGGQHMGLILTMILGLVERGWEASSATRSACTRRATLRAS